MKQLKTKDKKKKKFQPFSANRYHLEREMQERVIVGSSVAFQRCNAIVEGLQSSTGLIFAVIVSKSV